MKQLINYIISELRGFYPEEELCELAYWIIEETTGMTRTQILTADKGTKNIPNIEIILQKLRANEPIQYVFGHTEWMGLDLRVTPATLIPRPETAELVAWVLQMADRDKSLRVLDIGTGSGCIALALKKSAPCWQVTGVDISQEALEVADFLKAHPESTVTLCGYADKGTGNPTINAKLAEKRVKAVADALINKFGIAESRITIDHKGDTVQPMEGTANRVTIAVAISKKVVEVTK